MTFEEAKALLNKCDRSELRDHAFGDREVIWYDSNNQHVAEGYFSGDISEVSFATPSNSTVYKDTHTFSNEDANELVTCGRLTLQSVPFTSNPIQFAPTPKLGLFTIVIELVPESLGFSSNFSSNFVLDVENPRTPQSLSFCFRGVWSFLTPEKMKVVKTQDERITELEGALREYANPKNWTCLRCKGRDCINCQQTRWVGPLNPEDPCDPNWHGFAIASAALAGERTEQTDTQREDTVADRH